MVERMVSILTPCFNGVQYIDRYSQSLLSQDYSNCQLIFMDDGSTDGSREKILSYKERFEDKGFSFEYHYHDNVGVGATIAEGITYVKGEYLIWPDIDDLLVESSIRKKVDYLENRTDLGVVRTNYLEVREPDIQTIIGFGANKFPNRFSEELFIDCISLRNVWFQPGCYMIRMRCFDTANPERYIYPSRSGQNAQMLIPMFYRYKCGYLDEPLYIYVLHDDSLSNVLNNSTENKIEKSNHFMDIYIETIKHMNILEEKRVLELVENSFTAQKIEIAFRDRNKKVAIQCYKEMRSKKNIKAFLKAYGAESRIVHRLVGV